MTQEARESPRGKTALVLAGGAARGAYEVGVVDYVLKDVARAIGRDVPIDILCGTSAGAINACFLAAHADAPTARADRLRARWLELRIEEVVRPSTRRPPGPADERRGGLLDPAGIESIVSGQIPFERIGEHMRAGRLCGLTVSTTHVASGRTVVFVERKEAGLPSWSRDPTMTALATEIRAGSRVHGIHVGRLVAEIGCQPAAAPLPEGDGASNTGLHLDVPVNAAALRIENEKVTLGAPDIDAPTGDDRLRSSRTRARKPERPF